MEEKKLTDEEIVKELINESNRGEWCELSFIDCVEVRVLKNALDLIHRLQIEKSELQKQVDELKEERYYTEKDTAKEILQGICKWLNQSIIFSYDVSVKGSLYYGGKNSAFHEVKELVEKVAESKGVEVE